MSELITKTQTFLHRTPIEPVNYTGEVADNPEKNRKWLKRFMVAAVGYIAFVAVDNATFYYETTRVSADDPSMLYDIDGCDPFPKVVKENDNNLKANYKKLTEAEIQAMLNVELDFKDTTSAARNFEPLKFNPLEFTLDWVEIHKHEQLNFISDISGLEVHLYSDTEDNPFIIEDETETVDVIDELIHSSLDERVSYKHAGVEAYVDCLRERFIDMSGPRELEGQRLDVYVPSTPGVCFSNGLVQEFPEGAIYKEFCDSVGATKDIRITVRPIYEYRRNWMAIMTTNKESDVVDVKLSRMFVHEPTHFLMETAGMPFRLDKNESLAQHLEHEVINQLYSDGLPTSLSYRDETYEEIQD